MLEAARSRRRTKGQSSSVEDEATLYGASASGDASTEDPASAVLLLLSEQMLRLSDGVKASRVSSFQVLTPALE